jgi:hypothetical protein
MVGKYPKGIKMDKILEFYQEKLKRTEENLKLFGAIKCKICNVWVDNSYINDGVCGYCIEKKE